MNNPLRIQYAHAQPGLRIYVVTINQIGSKMETITDWAYVLCYKFYVNYSINLKSSGKGDLFVLCYYIQLINGLHLKKIRSLIG